MTASARRAAERPPVTRLALLRTALVGGAGVAALAALLAGDPAPVLASDPDLARLLRGMALVKATLVAGALAVLWWRFGQPLATRFAAGYLAGAWLAAGACAAIWQLTLLGPAVLVFHAGELALLVVAWRDHREAPRWRWPSRRRP